MRAILSAALLGLATLAANPVAAQERVYTVPELIAAKDSLLGQAVRVRAWFDECIPDACGLLPEPPVGPAPTSRPVGLEVGNPSDYRLNLHELRFQGVLARVRVGPGCGADEVPCRSPRGDLTLLERPSVIAATPTARGWPGLYRGGPLVPLATPDPALGLAVRELLAKVRAGDRAGLTRAAALFNPGGRDDAALREAVLFEGTNPPATALANGGGLEMRLLSDPETDADLARSLGAEAVATACVCLKPTCGAQDWPREVGDLLVNRANPYICFDAARRGGLWRVSPG
jgi:hypothetical protein